jgi:hypothetical protein
VSVGIRGSIADYRCAHHVEMNAELWPDDIRLSDLEPKFTCQVCQAAI